MVNELFMFSEATHISDTKSESLITTLFLF